MPKFSQSALARVSREASFGLIHLSSAVRLINASDISLNTLSFVGPALLVHSHFRRSRMALLNISSDWLDADSRASYMLLRNGDDFDLHLHPLVEPDYFYKTEKLLDVITPEGHICRVVLSKKTFYSNVEVVYVLKTDRGCD